MASDDFSGVNVAFTAQSYPKGATMTVNVTGQNRHTSDGQTTHETGTANVTVQTQSGGTISLQTAPVDVVTTKPGATTFEDVTIVSVTDTAGRAYTIASGGRSATAVA